MQIQLKDLLNFSSFFEEIKHEKLPLRTLYKLSLISKEVHVHEEFYKERLNSIAMNYGKYDASGRPMLTADGQGLCLQEGKEQQCYSEMAELENFEVTLPDITFSFEDFPDGILTLSQMEILLPFFKE